MNEATARLKINKLLERAGWRYLSPNFPAGARTTLTHTVKPQIPRWIFNCVRHRTEP